MTREELRDYVEFLRSQNEISYDVYSGLIDGIDTLEQEPILDKTKENIQFIKDKCLPNNIAEEYEQKGLQEALDIINKYKAESEDT